jgi:hypothetical protein
MHVSCLLWRQYTYIQMQGSSNAAHAKHGSGSNMQVLAGDAMQLRQHQYLGCTALSASTTACAVGY